MNSFIPWIGGKKLLRKYILEQFPEVEFGRYIDVFGGAAWVLFYSDRHAKLEVYNDVNGNLVNLFRCVKYHPEELQKELDWVLVSRELFEVNKQTVLGETDIQRAAKFFITIRESFGANRKNFCITNRNMVDAVEYLKNVSDRLKSVVIENMDFERLLEIYDREVALFYLDPPYYDAEKYYPDRFNPEDHIRLRNILDQIKGKFILSYNDAEVIRELYKNYQIVEVERNNNLTSKQSSTRYKEILIKNY